MSKWSDLCFTNYLLVTSISSLDLNTTDGQVFQSVLKLNRTSRQVDFKEKTSSNKELSLEITLPSEKHKSNDLAVGCPYRQLSAHQIGETIPLHQELLLLLCWTLLQQLNAK